MDPDFTPTRRSGLTENLTGQDLFIYDGDGQELTVLNRTALMIWSLCDGDHDRDQMLEVMSGIFPEAPADTLATDLDRCLRDFREKALLASPP